MHYEAPSLQTGSSSVSVPVLLAIGVVAVALIFGTLVVERYGTRLTRIPNVSRSKHPFIAQLVSPSRAKAFLWPSIPNPRHSNALQKLGRPCELVKHWHTRPITVYQDLVPSVFSFPQELLETINTLKVEEGDTDSLQIMDKDRKEEEAAAASAAAEALLPWLPQDKEDEEDEEDEDHFAKTLTASIQGQPAGGTADIPPYIPADAFTGGPRVDLHKGPPPATVSGYTTLEMFQQATPQGAPASTQTGGGWQTEEEEAKPRSNYIRPLSSNSVGMSTFL